MTDHAAELAELARSAARREHERRGTGRRRATVLRIDPLLLDLHGSELQLDDTDVTVSRAVKSSFAVGDVLVLVEVDTDEWVAVASESADDDPPAAHVEGAFVGQIAMSALATPADGWLVCDGAGVVAADHPDLRAKLIADGSPHGTDGSGNPRVPNLNRGAFAMGAGGSHALGATGGEETHLLTAAEAAQKAVSTGNDTPDHTHASDFPGSSGANNGAGVAITVYTPSVGGTTHATGGASARHTHPVAGSDAATAHNNNPLFTAVTFVIYAGDA